MCPKNYGMMKRRNEIDGMGGMRTLFEDGWNGMKVAGMVRDGCSNVVHVQLSD